mmetsp:Transcript_28936/g.92920  ORF Transcript_28936/g.92920 Transcript_28936/m.92920 type:complete len:258 (+) Transcript_28936:640-1413(+)
MSVPMPLPLPPPRLPPGRAPGRPVWPPTPRPWLPSPSGPMSKKSPPPLSSNGALLPKSAEDATEGKAPASWTPVDVCTTARALDTTKSRPLPLRMACGSKSKVCTKCSMLCGAISDSRLTTCSLTMSKGVVCERLRGWRWTRSAKPRSSVHREGAWKLPRRLMLSSTIFLKKGKLSNSAEMNASAMQARPCEENSERRDWKCLETSRKRSRPQAPCSRATAQRMAAISWGLYCCSWLDATSSRAGKSWFRTGELSFA